MTDIIGERFTLKELQSIRLGTGTTADIQSKIDSAKICQWLNDER